MARRYALASIAAGATASTALLGGSVAFCSENNRSTGAAAAPLSGECVNDRNDNGGSSSSSRRGRFPSSSGFPSPLQGGSVDSETVTRYRGGAIIATSAAALSGGGDGEQKLRSTYVDRFVRLIRLMNPRHTLTTESDVRRYQRLLKDNDAVEKTGSSDEDLLAAAGKVDASCNVATGEVIPAPFRLSGFLLCNIPIVATMLFSKSVYVQVMAHWINQSLNTAVNYYNRSGAEMTAQTLATSYALAIGTACPLAFGLGKAFQRAPPSMKRFSFVASYVAVAAAGSLNVLFTRASEITGGVQVTDESGEVRGVSKKAGLQCVMQTVASRGLILPLPVVVLPAIIVGVLKRQNLMPTNPRAKMWAQVGVITASLAFALPVSIAVFPQEARFRTDSLEPELQNLRLKSGSRREVTYLYANKGL